MPNIRRRGYAGPFTRQNSPVIKTDNTEAKLHFEQLPAPGTLTLAMLSPTFYATPTVTLGTAAAAGSLATLIRSDATIAAFDATNPTTSAVGDAAATGSVAFAARRDHKHGRESFATNTLVLGTAAAAGSATTLIRSDDTIAAFDATVPTTSAVGDAAATGSVAKAARRDHVHGREAFGSPVAVSPTANADGTATTDARSDHKHIGTGSLGYAEATSNQTAITDADVTSLSVTVSVVSGRRIRITYFEPNPTGTSAGDDFGMRIQESTTVLQSGDFVIASANQHNRITNVQVVLTPSAGSHTYKARVTRTSGSGTLSLNRASTQPAFILVEDIGT